jgi:hypothetical protein
MSVSDDGQGVPSTEVEHLFFAEHPPAHAGAVTPAAARIVRVPVSAGGGCRLLSRLDGLC